MARHFLTAEDLRDLAVGSELRLTATQQLTDQALELAAERRIRILPAAAAAAAPASTTRPCVAVASDHSGVEIKADLVPFIRDLGYTVLDLGVATAETPADYPDQAAAVARAVLSGEAGYGIVLDAAGNGSAMAANKLPGIRAALCYDRATARSSREHNDANVLTLGARFLTPELARAIVWTWLSTSFAGGRHAARVAKLAALDARPRS